jgi:hypothetical protein
MDDTLTSLNFFSPSRNDHPSVITLSNNGIQSNNYLTCETKVDMVLRAGMNEPVIKVLTRASSQYSPMTTPSLNNTMTSSNLSKEAEPERYIHHSALKMPNLMLIHMVTL